MKSLIKKLPGEAASFLIEIYRFFFAAGLGMRGCCRFTPSCSEYAVHIYKTRPFFEASRLIFFRLLSCRPFGPPLWRQAQKERLLFSRRPGACARHAHAQGYEQNKARRDKSTACVASDTK